MEIKITNKKIKIYYNNKYILFDHPNEINNITENDEFCNILFDAEIIEKYKTFLDFCINFHYNMEELSSIKKWKKLKLNRKKLLKLFNVKSVSEIKKIVKNNEKIS